MSRTTERARASFSRSSGTLRLASVITMLLVVGLLMKRAADERTWFWLTGAPANQAAGPSTVTVAPNDPVVSPPTPGPTDQDEGEQEAVVEQFQAISDGTTQLGREEMPAYWRLFAWTQHQSLAELQARADHTAVLNQFVQHPAEQRGKLFQLDLNVRRVLSFDAPRNSAGIEKVYEIWGWTTESKAWLYVVLTAELPPGMPVGPDVHERVRFAGYFLKVQGYQAAGAGPRDKPLVAPLFVGRLAWKPAVAAAPVSARSYWVEGAVALVALVGAVGLSIWMFLPGRSAGRSRRGNSRRPASESPEVQAWLEQAENKPAGDSAQDAESRYHFN